MKKKKCTQRNRLITNRRKRPQQQRDVNDLLRQCLQKVCELQQELNKDEETEDDAQAAGYAACAVETLQFLAREGLPDDHPMVKALREKLQD